MPRPPKLPDRSTIPAEELEFFDATLDRQRAMKIDEMGLDHDPGVYPEALLNSPPWAAALTRIGTLIRTSSERGDTYSHFEQEWADQVISYHLEYYGFLAMHTLDAVAYGIRIEAIDALREGRDDALTEEERLLADYVRGVVDGTVNDATYAAMEKRLSPRGLVEYTVLIAFLLLSIRVQQAFTIPGPSETWMNKLLQDLRDGTRELPDTAARLR